MKHFTRQEKIALIEVANPAWEDLAADLFPTPNGRVQQQILRFAKDDKGRVG